MNEPDGFDIAIIGAGPIGIEMAVALKKAGSNYVHFEAAQIGSTIQWWAPQTRFFSSNERIAIAGVPLNTLDQAKASREEYLAYLRTVVGLFELPIRTYEKVNAITRDEDGFAITSDRRGEVRTTRAAKVILSVGGTDRPRMLGVPGENLPHVAAYFKDPHIYFRQRVLIIGGKNSAVEAALRCHHAGADVAISYRREAIPEKHIKYWLMPEIRGLIDSGAIKFYGSTTVEQIGPDVTILRHADATQSNVCADFVLKLIGYEQDNALLKASGLTLTGPQQRPSVDHDTMESDVPGLFVIGTAVAGTQEGYRVFIENCHVHVERVMNALRGLNATVPEPEFSRPES